MKPAKRRVDTRGTRTRPAAPSAKEQRRDMIAERVLLRLTPAERAARLAVMVDSDEEAVLDE